MNLDLIAFLTLLYGMIFAGPPDQVDIAWSVGLTFQYGSGGPATVLEIGVDPVAVRYRPAPTPFWPWTGDTCGLSDGYNVFVYPHDPCVDTLKHEMTHVQQRRALGPFRSWIMAAIGIDYEADPWYTAENMYRPKGLNYPLIRITIPLDN